ncbi:hypothetical protein CYPRO_1755 [Cyclonatronum proteinivorum]|uniref:PorV/PorQ family protein n=1 Tax=Cyclonatronum proteinivorum TaxID=1457365 RepID=A0A345UKK3_9BACT|nr:hypothetical protein [Cyclonatronum proteinivorum]AXJ01005.1 hypothetical protein CYPRO_1755 [Cyclonatronum proteinivorum]
MKIRFRGLVLFSLITLFFSADLMAQNGGFAGAFSRMGFGPRGMGMGNAMTAVHHQGVFAHYNPAIASTVQDTQFDFSASSMSFDRQLNLINTAFILPPNAGINIGLLHAGVSDFDGRTTSGVPTSRFSTNEFNAFIAFGLNPGRRLSLGFAANLYYASYFENVDNPLGFGLDVGFLYQLSEQFTIGASVQDMFANYTWSTSGVYGGSLSNRSDSFPVRYKIGAAYEIPAHRLLISADFETRSESAQIQERLLDTSTGQPVVRNRFSDITTGSQMLRLGVQYGIHERIDLRAGWDSGDLSALSESQRFMGGFSLKLPLQRINSAIDYAFVREPEGISFMHVFGLRIIR